MQNNNSSDESANSNIQPISRQSSSTVTRQCSVSARLPETTDISYAMEARQAAQFGDVVSLRRLLDAGSVTPNCIDSDDCSLLHWAAINNRLEFIWVAQLLVERKCNVNAVGGVLASTPLHWAARHGHSRMVALLVRSGADWTLRDVEGFTPLHIAVQFGCTPVAAYLIAAGQSPDELDTTRMTPAIWAAYKVYNVDPLKMLVKMGADLEKADSTYKNTPMHWAVLQNNHTAINTLIKLNVDLMAVNKEKETPLDIARRKNDVLSIRLLELALRERKFAPSTFRQRLKEDRIIARNVIFSLPFIVLFSTSLVLNSSLVYPSKAGFLFALGILVYLSFRFFAKDRREFCVHTLLFGLALASKLFMILSWLIFLHPVVPWHMQIIFFLAIMLVPVLFYRMCTTDPGFINVSHKERCRMIVVMTEEVTWKGNFCSTCLITRPIRSKHCQICDKCVYLFDHHCPWINNCVGGRNHRTFVVYLIILNLSCFLVFTGCLIYWRDVCGQISTINVVFCRPWVFILHLLSLFYAVFLGSMNCLQAYQIVMAMTTNERLNSHRYTHFQSTADSSLRSPFTRGCVNNVQTFWCRSEEELKPEI